MVTLDTQVSPRPQLLSILTAALDPLRSARVALSSIFLIHGVIGASWVSRLPSFQEQYQVGPAALSLALFCCAIGAVSAMPLAKKMHFGSAKLTVLFTLLQSSFLLLLPAAFTFPLFCAALFCYGFVASCMNISMNAHAVHIERMRTAPIMSSFHGYCSLGCMAGALLGSLICQFDMAPPVHFAIVAIPMMLVAYSVRSHLLPDNHTPADEAPAHTQHRFTPPSMLVVALCAMAVCSYVSEGAMGDWTAIYLHSVLRASESLAALGFAIFSVAMCLGRFCGDRLVLRVGAGKAVRTSAALGGIGLVAALLANNPYLALGGFAAVGLGLSIIVPTIYSTAARTSTNPGAAIALVSMCGYAGILGGPPVIGFTAELTGLRIALGLICFLIVTIVVIADRLCKLSGQSEETPPNLRAGEVALEVGAS